MNSDAVLKLFKQLNNTQNIDLSIIQCFYLNIIFYLFIIIIFITIFIKNNFNFNELHIWFY